MRNDLRTNHLRICILNKSSCSLVPFLRIFFLNMRDIPSFSLKRFSSSVICFNWLWKFELNLSITSLNLVYHSIQPIWNSKNVCTHIRTNKHLQLSMTGEVTQFFRFTISSLNSYLTNNFFRYSLLKATLSFLLSSSHVLKVYFGLKLISSVSSLILSVIAFSENSL